MIKNLHVMRFTFLLAFGLFAFVGQMSAQCEAGDLQTTGTVNVPTGTTFDLMTMNEVIPTGGGFGWVFDNTNTDGMGALNQQFILFNQTGTETFDDDLNGVLSGNNLPLFTGTWILKGATYTDPADSFNSICSTTTDSLIVIFDDAGELECYSGEMQTVGEETVCAGASFNLETVNDTISAGGGLGWLFLTNNGSGTGALDGDFILTGVTGMEAYDADLNGLLSGNTLPEFAGTWVVKAATYSSTADAFNTICSTSEDSLLVTFNPEITASIANNFNTSLTVTPSGGTSPYTYLWSNGDTGETTEDLMDGTMTCVITDANGCEITESIDLMNTAIEDIEGLLNYELSPNPTSGFARLELGLEEAQAVKINIVGMDGKILQTVINERTAGGVYSLDMTSLNTGVYLVHITTDSGHFAERLFVR